MLKRELWLLIRFQNFEGSLRMRKKVGKSLFTTHEIGSRCSGTRRVSEPTTCAIKDKKEVDRHMLTIYAGKRVSWITTLHYYVGQKYDIN